MHHGSHRPVADSRDSGFGCGYYMSINYDANVVSYCCMLLGMSNVTVKTSLYKTQISLLQYFKPSTSQYMQDIPKCMYVLLHVHVHVCTSKSFMRYHQEQTKV